MYSETFKDYLNEKEIKVGDNLEKRLTSLPLDIAKKILDFLTSDKIKDNALADEIDYEDEDGKSFTVRFKDRVGNTKERKFKIGKLLKYLGADFTPKGYETEELVSYLKKTDNEVTILEGEDIRDAYRCDRGGGGIGSSCMGGVGTPKVF